MTIASLMMALPDILISYSAPAYKAEWNFTGDPATPDDTLTNLDLRLLLEAVYATIQ